MFTYGTYYQKKHSPCCTNMELLRGPRGPPGAAATKPTLQTETNMTSGNTLSPTVTELSDQVKQLTNLITLPSNTPINDTTLSDQVSALTAQVTTLTNRLNTITLFNAEQGKT